MNADLETYKALSRVQKNLKAPKGQFNKFGNYSYRSCEDILTAVKEILNEDELVKISDQIVLIGDRFYVKATAYFFHNGKNINTSAFARESDAKKGMDESQITGSASSYARKYALNGLFAIDDTKDADTRDNRSQSTSKQKSQAFKPSDEMPLWGKFKDITMGDARRDDGITEDVTSWIDYLLKSAKPNDKPKLMAVRAFINN